jgi:multifunctional beta-oxidation protein
VEPFRVWKRRLMLRPADDGRATHPTSTAEGMQQIMGNFENKASIVETVKETVRDAGKALKAKL